MHRNTNPYSELAMLLAALTTVAVGCGDSSGGDGNLGVLVEAEDTIPDGIESGQGEENITDGYSIFFEKYIISVGLVAMDQMGSNAQESGDVVVADFAALPVTGLEVTDFSGIPTGQYSEFGFQTPPANENAIRATGVSQDDFDAMVENGWSYFIRGTLVPDESTGGENVEFLIQAQVSSIYTACGVEDQPLGVNVEANSVTAITMHGDHLVFNGFPEEEGNVNRQAAWIALVADQNDDDILTQEDFEAATDTGSLFPSPPAGDYELTGGPLPINNAWDFVRGQLGTQGHILGEGECEWSPL